MNVMRCPFWSILKGYFEHDLLIHSFIITLLCLLNMHSSKIIYMKLSVQERQN